MPITINSTTFTDVWGNTTTFNNSNAGDLVVMNIDVSSKIYMSSTAGPFIIDTVGGTITSSSGSFEAEGFRVGQVIEGVKLNNVGFPIASWFATVLYCSGNVLKLDNVLIPDTANQESIAFTVISTNRESIDCYLNHVSNFVQSGDASLIDGEVTRFKFSQVQAMTIGGAGQTATIVGNQSGQYLKSAEISRISTAETHTTRYIISIEFVNPGIYNSEWFDSADCLKTLFRQSWSTLEGEPFGQTTLIYNNNANTGWFDQARNSDPTNSILVQGVTEIDYVVPSSFTLIVDGPLTDLGIGASYIPQTDSYFKNKPLQQGVYGMVTDTKNLAITTYSSELNQSGAGYTIRIDDIQSFGSQTFIEVVFTPNAQFASMMASTEDGDRLFYLWVKCGNLNLLAFSDQLTTSPPVGGELIMVDSFPFIDHSWNANDGSVNELFNRFDTEDDLAYYGTFLMDKGGSFSSFRVRIEGFNTVTNEDFTLKETVFSLAATQINSSGVYLINEILTVNSQLPTTSLKRDAIFKYEPSIDTLTQFGVSIYYPVILDWRYWIQQLNVDSDFYPNQNKNWQQYSNSGNWIVRMELELIKDGLAFTHSDEISILDYDAKAQVISSLQYIKFSDSSVVSGLIYGEVMKLKSKHINLLGSWSPETWGMLTIEPKESSPRWISSTVIDFDNNSSSPLYPLPGETKALLTLSANIAYIECLCDTTKLTGGNQSVTAKIKDPNNPEPPLYKTTSPDDVNKTTSPIDDDFKTLA